jgi:hypothetical protein
MTGGRPRTQAPVGDKVAGYRKPSEHHALTCHGGLCCLHAIVEAQVAAAALARETCLGEIAVPAAPGRIVDIDMDQRHLIEGDRGQ